jgi:hypothetical protein
MTIFLGWMFFCVAAAMFAHYHCNRSGGAWFGVAFFFSPIVAFVLLAILPAAVTPTAYDQFLQRKNTQSNLLVIVGILALTVVITIILTTLAPAQEQQTFRDATGRSVGTATRSGNQTTFRDASGRTTGTATTDSGGTTIFRDSRGRTTGTLNR